MQTSRDASGENDMLPCQTTSGKQQRPVGTASPKPKRRRRARCVGRPGKKKQRPKCRVTWRHRRRHWVLDYYGQAVAEQMRQKKWTERDLAAAAAICPTSIHNLLVGKLTADMDQDLRLHCGLELPFGTLSRRARELLLKSKKHRR